MHSSEKRWSDVSGDVSAMCEQLLDVLVRGNELFNRLVQTYVYAGGTDEGLASLLFANEIAGRGAEVPSVAEVEKAADLRAAMVAINELWQGANSVALTAEDRATLLRRLV